MSLLVETDGTALKYFYLFVYIFREITRALCRAIIPHARSGFFMVFLRLMFCPWLHLVREGIGCCVSSVQWFGFCSFECLSQVLP